MLRIDAYAAAAKASSLALALALLSPIVATALLQAARVIA
jgi:hypothetical protein